MHQAVKPAGMPGRWARTSPVFAWLIRSLAWALWLSWVLAPAWWRDIWIWFNEDGLDPLYHADSLGHLALWHLGLSVTATVLAASVAVTLALLVTRARFSRLKPLVEACVRLGQTIPPVVVLALVIPWLGFGNLPTLMALFLYGLLPVFERSLTGLRELPVATMEAAVGMGLSPLGRLWRVELPLAMPTIMEGIRLSLTINVGTATLGSTVAAKSLGEVILAGLLSNNNAYIVQGALITGLLAMLLYDFMGMIKRFTGQSNP
jgi:osmoprotectant transport system permease protein